MLKLFRKLWNSDRGNALVIAAAALPLVIGSAGLATDTIQWTLWKRQLQRAADSAAMAGVYAIVATQDSSTAVTKDLTFNDNTNITEVSGYPVISFPADTPTYSNAVKVDLAVQRNLAFSGMFTTAPIIKASATAAIADSGTYCVVSLEKTSTTGIVDSGNSTVDLGCGMITNSTSLNAAIATGSASVNASPVAAVGGIQKAKQWGSSTLLPFTVAEDDPFSGVNIPNSGPSSCQTDPRVNPQDNVTLSPGCFKGMTLNGTVKLNPGIYYIDGGNSTSNPNGLSFGSQASIDGTAGVTFVLTNSDTSATAPPIGNVTINGSATVNLTAPKTGCTIGNAGCFDGLVMYQDRRASDDGNSSNSPNLINGNSSSTFNGAFYFPNQQVGFNGNGGLNTDCFQLVSRRVDFKGNMKIKNTCKSTDSGHSFKGQHVRLVA